MSQEPASVPLQLCLCCGYSLAGLPAEHECPECGFPYDSLSTAIELGREPNYRWGAVNAIIVVIVFVILIQSNSRNGLIFFFVVLTIAEGMAGLLSGRIRTRLVMDSRGVHRVRAGAVQKSILWEDLKGLEFSRFDGALLAKTKSGRTIALARNAKIAKKCRRDVDRAWLESQQLVGNVKNLDV